MTKQETRGLLERTSAPRMGQHMSANDQEAIISTFTEHFRLAARSQKPGAALHTAYTAAANLVASRPGKDPGTERGVKAGTERR